MIQSPARWSPGSDVGIVCPSGIALVSGELSLTAAERIWTTLQRKPDLGTFLQELSSSAGTGLLDLPDFAVAVISGSQCHVAVRGRFEVEIVTPDGAQQLTGEGITTWAEKMVAGALGVQISSSETKNGTAPISSGVVVTSVLQWGEPPIGSGVEPWAESLSRMPMQDESPMAVPQPVVIPVVPGDGAAAGLGFALEDLDSALSQPEPEPNLPEPEPNPPEPEPNQPEPEILEQEVEPEVSESHVDAVIEIDPPAGDVAESEPPQVDEADSSAAQHAVTLGEEDLSLLSSIRAEQGEPELDPPEDAPHQVDEYAMLWDETVGVDLEAAAIRENEEDGGDPAPKKVSEDDRQRFGETIIDEDLVDVVLAAAEARHALDAEAGVKAPMVLSRFCDRGHPNPPERATCYVCSSTVSGDAQSAQRPQLGWLRVEGGETVPINGPIIAGRNPKSTVLKLEETPRLLALPHPHVSSNHIAFLIEGWRILARDLQSSNGSYLRRFGKPPVRLPEHPVPLVPGDLIDLGRGVFIHLERTP